MVNWKKGSWRMMEERRLRIPPNLMKEVGRRKEKSITAIQMMRKPIDG